MSAVLEAPVEITFKKENEKNLTTEFSERAQIDDSCRGPVLFFYTSAILWLLAGSVFGLLAAWKMHEPEFLDSWAALTFSRLRTAHLNVVAYGWASEVGVGTMIWLMARLCRTPLRYPWIAFTAGIFWNIGLTVGIIGILGGDSTSIEWLEMPAYATPMIFVAFALVAIWVVIMFRFRKPGHVYVSQWFLFAAIFWFPWLYGTANIIMHFVPMTGVTIGAVNWWYGHNVLGLWFTPIGLATAYYLIPKVIGRPIHSYYLSAIGFWSLALFYSWNGMHHLIGGPFPAWLITASIVASLMMVIPVITTAINHHMTMKGNFEMLKYSPTLRFVVFGAMAYTLVSLQGSSMAFRGLNKLTHFTHYTVGHSHLGLYAFYTMIMFGAIYYIVPRLVGCEWRSSAMIKWHFWLSAYGIITMVFVLSAGGLAQGLALLNPTIAFKDVVEGTLPWLFGRSLSGMALTLAHIIFAFHFMLMLFQLGRKGKDATLFASPQESTSH